MSIYRFLVWLLLVPPSLGQTAGQTNFLASSPTIDCTAVKQLNSLNTEAVKTNQDSINLRKAIALVIAAINEARCENYDPAGRFQLNTADLDFQTLVDKDGSLEVLFIGGLAGELDKQVTSDSDFTYSVPTPIGVKPEDRTQMMIELARKPKTKVTPAKTLGEAIAAAMNQMAAGVGDLPALSQHQVKVSIKFAFTKSGTLELEAKPYGVGITFKYKKSVTTTQTLTLTFADQVPVVNLNATPSSPIAEGVSVTLIASVVPPTNSTVMPEGNVTFLDGNVSLGVQQLKHGFAGLIVPTLSSGVHSLTAVYGSDQRYDSVASSATVMVVEPNVVQH